MDAMVPLGLQAPGPLLTCLALAGGVAMAAPSSGCGPGWWSMVLPFQQERKHSNQQQGGGAVRECISGNTKMV